jgi:hypothetical protein
VAGDEHLGIELSNRLQRINGAVLVMRKVGWQQARSDTVERGMGGDQCVAGDQHPDVRQEEAGVPGGVAGGRNRDRSPGQIQSELVSSVWPVHRHPGTRTQEISERDDSRGPTAATRYGRSLTLELLVGRARNDGNSR